MRKSSLTRPDSDSDFESDRTPIMAASMPIAQYGTNSSDSTSQRRPSKAGIFSKDKEDVPPRSSGSSGPAEDLLEAMGYTQQLARSRSTWSVTFMSFVLASVPYGLSTTLVYPLTNGGPATIIWGWVAVCLLMVCVAASLGEITSVRCCNFPPFVQWSLFSVLPFERDVPTVCLKTAPPELNSLKVM